MMLFIKVTSPARASGASPLKKEHLSIWYLKFFSLIKFKDFISVNWYSVLLSSRQTKQDMQVQIPSPSVMYGDSLSEYLFKYD